MFIRIWFFAFANGASDVRFVWDQWLLDGWVMESSQKIWHMVLWVAHDTPCAHSLASHSGTQRTAHVFTCKIPIVVVHFWKNRNVSTNFSKIPLYKISSKSVQHFLSCYMQTGRYSKVNTYIFVSCKYTYKWSMELVALEEMENSTRNIINVRWTLQSCCASGMSDLLFIK
jgi:hypothetical protein